MLMGSSRLPNVEDIRRGAIGATAALLIAFNPLQVLADEVITVQDQAPAELSPAQMLVKKTTEAQVTTSMCSSDGVAMARLKVEVLRRR